MCSNTYTCICSSPYPRLNKYIKNSLKIFKHLNLLYKHSPTYKHGNHAKLMQITHFTAKVSIEITFKYAKMTKSKKTTKTRQKLDFGMEPKITTLLPTCF